MTVGKLIEILETLPLKSLVIMASDAEGNTYHKLDDVGENDDEKGNHDVVLWPHYAEVFL